DEGEWEIIRERQLSIATREADREQIELSALRRLDCLGQREVPLVEGAAHDYTDDAGLEPRAKSANVVEPRHAARRNHRQTNGAGDFRHAVCVNAGLCAVERDVGYD